ncbi:MAG: sodium-dependent transporter [Aquificaceae bacterium]|nr:sodium-dependent transporter [Aquificaceae bacterium]MCX8075859.1 sodium-dependent transporter [Aquificaceae bacterium]
MNNREVWATRVGLIFAAAGNAVGLGNLLRFPSKVALYGGGAFMVPYFVALFLIGMPLMVLEWVIGRYAGARGHGSMTGIMGSLFHHANWARVLGSIGVAIPFLIVCYYIYIESWTLGFAVLSLLGQMPPPTGAEDYKQAMQPYVDFYKSYTKPSTVAIVFLVITLLVNWYILQRGVVRGIELTAKFGIPALLLMGLFLGVISLSIKGGKGLEGLFYIFTPDLSKIGDPQVWLEASGQIFFTLSLGMGAIATYASYVKAKEDVLKASLWTAGINEFVEVVIGASIAIPAAFAMFGALAVPELAKEGTFRLGFMSMPAVLMALPLGWLLSAVWFFLLFIAALTSSLALTQPLVSLFEDEMRWSHSTAVNVSMLMVSVGAFLSAFVPSFIDEVDFWAGTLMLVFFALVEIIVFVWIFGTQRFHRELTRDVFFKVPLWLVYFFAVVSPIFIFILLYQWGVLQLPKVLANTSLEVMVARFFVIAVLVLLAFLSVESKRRYLSGPHL